MSISYKETTDDVTTQNELSCFAVFSSRLSLGISVCVCVCVCMWIYISLHKEHHSEHVHVKI